MNLKLFDELVVNTVQTDKKEEEEEEEDDLQI